MLLNEKIKTLLLEKLHFSMVHLDRLEKNPELLSRALGLLQLLKGSSQSRESRLFAIGQLKQIRNNLNKPEFKTSQLMLQARSEYYTFRKSVGWSFTGRTRS